MFKDTIFLFLYGLGRFYVERLLFVYKNLITYYTLLLTFTPWLSDIMLQR